MTHNIHLRKLSALDISSCITCISRILDQSMSWENAQLFATTSALFKLLYRQINIGA